MEKTPLHILLIEDNAEDRADMRQMLLRGGNRRYRFSEAQFGDAGIRMVRNLEHGPVDCVLLDYGLPDMDAPEVLALLRDGAELPPCPVVVITGTASEEGQGLLSAGAQDFIGKRWTSADSLTRAVENAIERYALQVQRRQVAEALRASEERYRALFESIDVGYSIVEVIFDAPGSATDARYMQVNPAFARHTGLTDVEAKTVRELVPGIEQQWLDMLGAVALSGVPARLEQYSESMSRWFDVFAFRLGEPRANQVAVLVNDTTERKRVEAELISAKAAADEANRAKSDFLLSMSHELRSPLGSMLGFTQMIELGTPPPTAAQQDSVEHILKAGWYLLGLINEILDLTSIESGKLTFSPQPMSLKEVLDDCQTLITPQAQSTGIRVVFPHLEQPYMVHADPVRTKQVLVNLLTNAIKYNRVAGQVHVHCAVAPGQSVRVSVEDTGEGLAEQQLAELFQPFQRLGQESGTLPGTGIGLVICKRLVELMGGRIGVNSTAGVGSCFWFELNAVTTPSADSQDTPSYTLLCVENDAGVLKQVENILGKRSDIRLLRARDLQHVFELARAARPDVILTDIDQPNLPATQQMLASHPATALIPIIVLTADLVPREVEATLASSFGGVFTLPMQSDAFTKLLDRTFEHTHAGSERTTAKEEA